MTSHSDRKPRILGRLIGVALTAVLLATGHPALTAIYLIIWALEEGWL